jgi:hypothetical protein
MTIQHDRGGDAGEQADDKSLFTSRDEEERLAMRRGAVAATAAVVLAFREN